MSRTQKILLLTSAAVLVFVGFHWSSGSSLSDQPPSRLPKTVPYFLTGSLESNAQHPLPTAPIVTPPVQTTAQPSKTALPPPSAFMDDSETFLSANPLLPLTFYPRGGQPPAGPSLSVKGALLANVKTGEVFYEVNGQTRWPLASLTKLMTATIASKLYNASDEVSVGSDDFPDASASNVQYLSAGQRYRMHNLMELMLLVSSNEAAEALASFHDRAMFINEMNKQAKEWGMNDTYFSDPSGLSVANQSTLQDLQTMMLHMYRTYPDVLAITRQTNAQIAEIGSGAVRTVSSINQFASRPDFLGGKTGYTDEASGNLITLFSYERQPVLLIVLGTTDRFGETQRLFDWFKRNYSPVH